MVKIKKKLKLKRISNSNYQIKTRNRDKKLCSMSREIKNLQESQWLPNSNTSNLKVYSENSKNTEPTKKRLATRFSKTFRKKVKKDLKLKKKLKNKRIKRINSSATKSSKSTNHSENLHNYSFSKNSKKNKNNHKLDNTKKFQNDINKYIYKDKEHFDLKEVLGFIYDELNIDLDSPNNRVKNREQFKLEMNKMFKKFFVIYYNKILVTPDNLYTFLEYLSKYIKLDAKGVLKLLNSKCKQQIIEERISLEQYFQPKLFLVDK